jgi:serine/threonine protein kinase
MATVMTQLYPGDKLDHYRLENVVASSGMAVIFRATELAAGRRVAVKIPHPEVQSDPVLLERFQRELEISRQLDHPGVIKVLDTGNSGQTYMAMEWIEGRLLRQILAGQGKLPADRAVRIALQICDCLEHIHGRGIVHRDLKPENIMVDPQDRITIIDFGIAVKTRSRRLTFGKLSNVMGTVDYISPEQVQGKRGDARSDIYALGIILYEMLTGRLPFAGPNAFAVMNDRVLNHPVPPREIDPTISQEIEEIVFRAIERDPSQRYASVRDFAWDLAHPQQVVVRNRSESQDRRERRSPVLHRVLIHAGLALIPIVIFGLMLLVAQHG